MPSQTPFILVDNVFDRINLYPTATLQTSGSVVGREPQFAADYRRERTFWQASVAAANSGIYSDLGVGVTKTVDSIWIDRGHNLWGKTVVLNGDDGAGATTIAPFTGAVPALGTVGGDPTTGWCVTEEGALYTLFATSAARRRWIVAVTNVFQPVIPGVVLGTRVQLLGYSSVIDEDAGDRFERTAQSMIPGYAGNDRTYSARTLELRLSLIGATEYDSSIRTLRRLLFDVNQPFVCCTNYGVNPERTWLYKYQGAKWSSPKTRTYRSAGIIAYEYGPLIR